MTIINFLWVGPPAVEQYKGQDIVGLTLLQRMDVRSTSHLSYVFWCLDDYREHYQKYFGDSVTVKSIESYVAERNSELLKFIETLMQKGKNREHGYQRSRDFVTIKAAFQYFLVQFEVGYIVDSNVMPFASDTLLFPDLDAFSVPEPPRNPDGSFPNPDPWLMYSPPTKTKEEENFKRYFDAVNKAYNNSKDGGFNFHTDLQLAFRKGLFAQDSDGLSDYNPLKLSSITDGLTRPASIGVCKRYSNSHRFLGGNTRNKDDLFLLIMMTANIHELVFYLEHLELSPMNKVEVPYQEKTRLEDGSTIILTHTPFKFYQSSFAHEMVKANKNVNLEAIINFLQLKDFEIAMVFPTLAASTSMTLLELSMFLKHDECTAIIINRMLFLKGASEPDQIQLLARIHRVLCRIDYQILPDSLEDIVNQAVIEGPTSASFLTLTFYLQYGDQRTNDIAGYTHHLWLHARKVPTRDHCRRFFETLIPCFLSQRLEANKTILADEQPATPPTSRDYKHLR